MKVIDYKKFQIAKMVYEKPIRSKGGCLITKTTYNKDNQNIPIYIQTPKLRTNSGIVLNDSRSYIDLELDKNHLGFYEFITDLDENNLTTTHSNSEEWFGQKLPMDVIDDFYNSPLRMSKLEKAPNVKFKIPVSKGKPLCEIFGDNSMPLDHEHVKKDVEVICILQLIGIKYYKQRFECDWQVIQMRAFINDFIPKACLIDETFMTDFEKEPEIFKLNTSIENNQIESNTETENILVESMSPIDENNVIENIKLDEDNTENDVIDIEVVNQENNLDISGLEIDTEILDTGKLDTEILDTKELDIENLESNEELENRTQSLENDLQVENLNLGEIELDDSEEELSEDEESIESEILSEEEELSDEISDMDDDIEEVYLDEEPETEPDSESEIEDDLDLEEVKLETGNEVNNLMNEIEQLKKIAIEKDEEVRKLKEMGQSAI